MLRLGSNAVYRLQAPIVARVGRPGADIASVRQTVAVARWLESVGYPAVRALSVDQPVILGGHAVTFWEALADEYATLDEVAKSDWLTPDDREFMADELARLSDEYARLEFVLPHGVIHTQEQYESFVRIYGYDITKWSGYPLLANIREFLMITWIIQKAGENEKTAAEARKRLNALRTGASRKDWSPFYPA